ncbi:hypothetical protein tpqmel_0986, partial [Candidatus Gastranaerophilus sp. (ex Termes propinquus)]
PESSYQVLRVIEGDRYVLDLNGNGQEDEDEIFHLYNVNSFPLRYSEKTVQYAENYGLSVQEAVALGYVGREWAKEHLLGQKVVLKDANDYNPAYNYRFAQISFKNQDLAKALLKEPNCPTCSQILDR